MAQTSSTTPFDWVRHISKSLIQLDEIPLIGAPTSFPWKAFEQQISQNFELQDLKITPGEWCWRTPEDLHAGLGDPLHILALVLSPLSGKLWWLMSDDDWSKLMGWLLTKTTEPLPIKQDDFRESFYRFAVIKAIHYYQQYAATTSLSPSLTENSEMAKEEAFGLDVTIEFQQQSVCGRLLLSKELRSNLKSFFAKQSSPLNAPIAQDVEVTVSINGGKTYMSLEEWQHVHVGDFVILDSCTADPTREEKGVILSVNGKPFLQGTLKNDKLNIIESPLTEEVDTPMADDAHEEEQEEASSEEDDEFAGIHEEFNDHLSEEHEEESQIHASEAEQAEVVEEVTTSPEPHEAAAAPTPSPTEAIDSEKSILAKEIPISLTVEIARVRMNVHSLINLQPGNMIDLAIHPEQGVNLTVNGKIVGRGELLRIGDTLGVRVLEIN